MTSAGSIRSDLLASAGLIAPPLLWAANTEAGQILPSVQCGGTNLVALFSFAAAILSAGAACLSWRTVRRRATAGAVTGFPNSFTFVGRLGGLSGALFAFALVLQSAASLVLIECAH